MTINILKKAKSLSSLVAYRVALISILLVISLHC